jgi:hypothetical protein
MRAIVVLVLFSFACLPPQEDPTYVKDLRVLGMSFEPPELLAPTCDALRGTGTGDGGIDLGLLTLAQPVQFKALISDPDGGGRPLTYRLLACSAVGDRECDNRDDFVVFDGGTTTAGVFEDRFSLLTRPARDGGFIPDILNLPDGVPLLQSVLEQDSFRGLGGVRVPVMLEISTGSERIYAQKLMILGCRFFGEQKPNATPVLPGVELEGKPWPEDEVRELAGKGPFAIVPEDFSALEEDYVVPSFQLTPVKLRESWKIAWYADWGTMSPFETGGTNAVGMSGQLRSRWSPGTTPTEPRVVTFTMMVRDGRGGQSWLIRKARWTPP